MHALKKLFSKEEDDESKEKVAIGESKPLIANNDNVGEHEHDEESATATPMGYHGITPPPASAPPPPPSSDDEIRDAQCIEGRTSSLTTDNNNNKDDDNASQSQLSQTHSTKSGRSRSKSKRKKKTDGTASIRSGKSTRTNKSKQKKKTADGPTKSICHLLFDSVRYLAIIASCMMFAMQIVPLYVLGNESTWLQIAVRSYLAIFCFFFILTEADIPILRDLLKRFAHSNWILRGFLYSFVGLIGMEQNIAIKVQDIAEGTGTSSVLGPDYGTLFATLFMSVTTWSMIGVGIIYFALGLICMQQLYDKMERTHKEKIREYKRKKKQDADFKKQQEEYRKYENDRQEGRGEWYDEL